MTEEQREQFCNEETVAVPVPPKSISASVVAGREVYGGSGAGQNLEEDGKCLGGLWHQFEQIMCAKNYLLDRCPRCHRTYYMDTTSLPPIWKQVKHIGRSMEGCIGKDF